MKIILQWWRPPSALSGFTRETFLIHIHGREFYAGFIVLRSNANFTAAGWVNCTHWARARIIPLQRPERRQHFICNSHSFPLRERGPSLKLQNEIACKIWQLQNGFFWSEMEMWPTNEGRHFVEHACLAGCITIKNSVSNISVKLKNVIYNYDRILCPEFTNKSKNISIKYF